MAPFIGSEKQTDYIREFMTCCGVIMRMNIYRFLQFNLIALDECHLTILAIFR
jgi:hypothetical protein